MANSSQAIPPSAELRIEIVGDEYTFVIGNATLRPRLNYAYIGEQFTNLMFSPITDRLAPRALL